jgi:hypothetical protein
VASKVFMFTECTQRYVMLADAWRDVAEAAKAVGLRVRVGDATTKVRADAWAVAVANPGILLVRDEWDDDRGPWEPATRV